MEKELSFERKISFKPLLISIFLGIMVATIICSLFPKYPLIGIIFGVIAFGLESTLIYPRYLPSYYGYWKIGTKGIYYYDYGSWSKKIQAIFLPRQNKFCIIPFSDIKRFSIVDGKSIMNTQYPLGGSLNTPLARKINCLVIDTDQQTIRLNCAWKSSGIPTTQTDIKNVVSYINSRI